MLCPACQSADLETFFDGGDVPLFVNVLHGTQAAAVDAPRGRIELGGCTACGFVHNVAFDPKLVEYAPGYENSLHGSPTFQTWANELAQSLVERHDLKGARAVEIGGGRGEFMELLLAAGLGRGLVMDPSAPEDAIVSSESLQLERRLFEASDAATPDMRTGLLLTRHVLEHLSDPFAFVSLLADAAREGESGLYVEVPNGLWTVRDLGVWDLIYEHCSYFTPRALGALMGRAGAESVVQETFGGQFLSAEAAAIGTPAPGTPAPSPAEDALRAKFGAAREATVEAWNAKVDSWANESKRAAIWGAGSKGATFLNSIENADVIDCAIDVNDRKVGRYVAGTGHTIVGPGAVAERDLDAIIVMNPRYLDEIQGMARAAGSQAEVLSIVQ